MRMKREIRKWRGEMRGHEKWRGEMRDRRGDDGWRKGDMRDGERGWRGHE